MATAILGLNAYHADSAACILVDGRIVAAAEEERFRRLKHWAGFPTESIRYCLREAGLTLDRVEQVAINRDPKANLIKKAQFTLRQRPAPRLLRERLSNARKWRSIEEDLRLAFPDQAFKGTVQRVEHHLAHLASAFLVSPFSEATLLSVDGSGDFASTAWGIGAGSSITLGGRVYYPHSLGIFYQAMTQFLGFPQYGDEYKVMGLAPYGEPRYVDALRKALILEPDGLFRLDLRYFRHHRESVGYEWNNCVPSIGTLYAEELSELLGPPREQGGELTQRHRDVARSVQAVYEETFFHILAAIHARFGGENIAVSGGCGQNSVANGKIYADSPFKRAYIPAASGDAGGAIGAAVWTWRQLGAEPARIDMEHAFWGPSFSNEDLGRILSGKRAELEAEHCCVRVIDDEGALCRYAAQLVAEGKVVGWFQGRMEWGPRALGNRSIVCDPRRADMKDVLNRKIKRRESFRPFAPSILREAVADWFETDDDVPFMGQVFQIREEQRCRVPVVTHVDGSGRLQTVQREANPRYYALIAAFNAITGVPVVLNTSFNENEPVVCRPEEALNCFLRTRMDALVLGDFVVTREDADVQQ